MAEELNQPETESGDATNLTRREVIKLGAGAAIAAAITTQVGTVVTSAAQGKNLLFFTKEEFALVDELTELIIPADDHSPGARAALVADFIDFSLSESVEESPKVQWRDGLKLIDQISQEMNGKPFLSSTPDQKIALLTRISKNEAKPATPEEHFFRELKSRTAYAYYTSKIGIHNEMEYKGNVSLKEFAGYDAT